MCGSAFAFSGYDHTPFSFIISSMISAAENTYVIKGTNFTPSSEVKLNGEWYETIYVNTTTLMITGTELSDFDRLSVNQRSNSSTRKALSKSFDRSYYALNPDSKWKLENAVEEPSENQNPDDTKNVG